MNKIIKKWWDKTSSRYQQEANIHIGSAHYGPYAPD
jgi:hypothetical protein